MYFLLHMIGNVYHCISNAEIFKMQRRLANICLVKYFSMVIHKIDTMNDSNILWQHSFLLIHDTIFCERDNSFNHPTKHRDSDDLTLHESSLTTTTWG